MNILQSKSASAEDLPSTAWPPSQPVYEATTPEFVRAVGLSPDGRYLAYQTQGDKYFKAGATRIVDLATRKTTATIAHLSLPQINTMAVFGTPCLAAILSGTLEASALAIVQCADGREVARVPLQAKRSNGMDRPHVAEACGVVVAQTLRGIIAYDTRSSRVRYDLMALLPEHFEHLFSVRDPQSCSLFFGSLYPEAETSVRIVSLDVRTAQTKSVLSYGKEAGRPLLSVTANSAASPLLRWIAVPVFGAGPSPTRRRPQPGAIKLYDARDHRRLPDIEIPDGWANLSSLVFLDEANLLIGTSGRTYVFSMASRTIQRTSFESEFICFDLAPRVTKLAAAGEHKIRVYDLTRQQ